MASRDAGAVAVIFRSRLRPDAGPQYGPLAQPMLELARLQPGFVSFAHFTADDGERLSLVEFASLETAQAWRDHPEHLEAQKLGRERFYSEYRIQVCTPIRDCAFTSPRSADDGTRARLNLARVSAEQVR